MIRRPTTAQPQRPAMPELRASLLRAAREELQPVVERRRVPLRVALAGFAVAVTLIVALVVAGTHSDGIGGSAVREAGGAPSRAVRYEYAVFRAPTSPGEEQNPFERDGIPQTPGVDPRQARPLAVPDRNVWVAPWTTDGKPGVCIGARSTIGDSGGFGACASLTSIDESGGLFVSSRPAPKDPNADMVEWYGLVRDGIGPVTLTLRDGSTQHVTAHDNTITGVFASSPIRIEYVDREGRKIDRRIH